MGSGKKPKLRKLPGQPHIASRGTPRGSTNHLRPIFSFYFLADGFRVSNCQQGEKAEFAQRLEELSQLTWGEINQTPRRGLGTETISRESIKCAPPPYVTPDVTLLSWRFGEGARIIGYRDNEVFHVVWVDPNHRVYPG